MKTPPHSRSASAAVVCTVAILFGAVASASFAEEPTRGASSPGLLPLAPASVSLQLADAGEPDEETTTQPATESSGGKELKLGPEALIAKFEKWLKGT